MADSFQPVGDICAARVRDVEKTQKGWRIWRVFSGLNAARSSLNIGYEL
jgi:hypothetical protein